MLAAKLASMDSAAVRPPRPPSWTPREGVSLPAPPAAELIQARRSLTADIVGRRQPFHECCTRGDVSVDEMRRNRRSLDCTRGDMVAQHSSANEVIRRVARSQSGDWPGRLRPGVCKRGDMFPPTTPPGCRNTPNQRRSSTKYTAGSLGRLSNRRPARPAANTATSAHKAFHSRRMRHDPVVAG